MSQANVSLIVRGGNWKKPPIPKLTREYKLRRRNAKEHGLTLSELDSLGNECHICGRTKTGRWGTLHIDHDHKTGKVRGKLCVRCNRGLGAFEDDVELLKKMIKYLRRHSV